MKSRSGFGRMSNALGTAINSLHFTLCDFTFRDIVDEFHCDLSTSVEWKTEFLRIVTHQDCHEGQLRFTTRMSDVAQLMKQRLPHPQLIINTSLGFLWS